MCPTWVLQSSCHEVVRAFDIDGFVSKLLPYGCRSEMTRYSDPEITKLAVLCNGQIRRKAMVSKPTCFVMDFMSSLPSYVVCVADHSLV